MFRKRVPVKQSKTISPQILPQRLSHQFSGLPPPIRLRPNRAAATLPLKITGMPHADYHYPVQPARYRREPLRMVFYHLGDFKLADRIQHHHTSNRLIYTVGDFLYRITEPVLQQIRNMLPNFGGIDFSPLIAILLLLFIKDGLLRQIYIWMAS